MNAEELKMLIRRYWEEGWLQKNFALLDEIVAEHFVDHAPGTSPDLPPGREGLKAVITGYMTAFPNMDFTIEEILVDGNTTVTRWTTRGTQTGPLMNIPPTGKHATITGISIDRFEDGKLVEEWAEFDMFGMLQQLGVITA